MAPPNNNNKQPKQKQRRAKQQTKSRPSRSPRMASDFALAPVSVAGRRATAFRVMSSSKAGSLRVVGQDYLGTVNSPAVCPPGTMLANYLINPLTALFKSTRVQAFGRLYEKYCFRSIKFHFESALASSTNGQVILAYDRDVADPTPPASDAGIHSYLGMAGSKTTAIWRPETIVCPLTDTQTFYYTNYTGVGDLRLTHQGQFYMAAMTNVPVSTAIGSLWIEYDLELYDPQIEDDFQETAASQAGNTVLNNTVKTAWNNLVGVATNVQNGQTIFGPGDGAGDLGFKLPGGIYQLLQSGAGANAASGFLAPTFVPNVTGQNMILTLLENLSVAAASASSNMFRLDQLEIPTGGGWIFGNTSNTVTLANPKVRVIDAGDHAWLY